MLPRHVLADAELIARGPKPAAVPLPRPARTSSEVVYEAARLLAGEPGAVTRLAAGHVPRPDGTCGGHELFPRPEWPCFAVQVAAVVDRMSDKGW